MAIYKIIISLLAVSAASDADFPSEQSRNLRGFACRCYKTESQPDGPHPDGWAGPHCKDRSVNGKAHCYVERNSCVDSVASKDLEGYDWSEIACNEISLDKRFISVVDHHKKIRDEIRNLLGYRDEMRDENSPFGTFGKGFFGGRFSPTTTDGNPKTGPGYYKTFARFTKLIPKLEALEARLAKGGGLGLDRIGGGVGLDFIARLSDEIRSLEEGSYGFRSARALAENSPFGIFEGKRRTSDIIKDADASLATIRANLVGLAKLQR